MAFNAALKLPRFYQDRLVVLFVIAFLNVGAVLAFGNGLTFLVTNRRRNLKRQAGRFENV